MNSMQRPFDRVAVLMGGPSSERKVSLRSGAAAVEALRSVGYQVEAVDVTERSVVLPEGTEAVFIALHGAFGEDGGVQELLEAMQVPYTGTGAEGSRLAMDKGRSRAVLQQCGIPVAPGWVVTDAGTAPRDLPAVIKPVRQGSSIGVHRVADETQWQAALQDAFRYDDEVLVEAFIPGRELTVGILAHEALPVVEIKAPEGWYGFEAKYQSHDTVYEVPAELSEAVVAEVQSLALATFDALGGRGFGRVDFRLSPDGGLFVLELNTIPGLTATSLLPKAAAARGIGFAELCHRIMSTAGV